MTFLLNPYAYVTTTGGFAPDDIAGLTGWWDASDTATITTSGNVVTAWNDKSSSGFDLTTVAGTPDSGTRTINGENAVDFSSGDGVSCDPGQIQNPSTGAHTVFAVVNLDSVSGLSGIVDGDDTSKTRVSQYLRVSSGTVQSIPNGGTTAQFTARTIDAGTTYILAHTNTGSVAETFLNAASDAEPTLTQNVGASHFGIGRRVEGLADSDGLIGEVICYDSALSDADRESVESYLAAKWGVTLPATAADKIAALYAYSAFDMNEEAYADSDPITNVANLTPEGAVLDLSQATGSKQPTKQTVSGNAVARFDGTADRLTGVTAVHSQPLVHVIVAKFDNPDTAQRQLANSQNSSRRAATYTESNTWRLYAGVVLDSGVADDTDWHVFVSVFSGASSKLYLDGGTAIASGNAGVEQYDDTSIGASDLGTAFWDGDWHYFAHLPYDAVGAGGQSLSDLNALGQELADRFGITWTDISVGAPPPPALELVATDTESYWLGDKQVTVPAATQENDLLLILGSSYNGDLTVSEPGADWSQLYKSDLNSTDYAGVWWRWARAADAGGGANADLTISNTAAYMLVVLRNVGAPKSYALTAEGTLVSPTISVTEGERVASILHGYRSGNDYANVTAPVDLTDAQAGYSDSDEMVAIAMRTAPATGTEPAHTWTDTGGGTYNAVSVIAFDAMPTVYPPVEDAADLAALVTVDTHNTDAADLAALVTIDTHNTDAADLAALVTVDTHNVDAVDLAALIITPSPLTAVDEFASVAFTSFDLTAEGFSDSTAIGTLTDQTGNGRDATQATGSQQPVAQTDTGMKVARFDGTNDVMQTATWTVEPQPNTVVALARFTAGLANTRFVFDGGATDRNALFNDGGTGKYSSYAGTTIDGSASDTSWHVFVARFDGASSAVWIDGVQNFAGNAGTQGLTRLTIGAAMDAAGGYLNGDVNFIGLYDGDLKTDDLTLLNNLGQELADRAGITWTDIAAVDEFASVAFTAFDLTAEGFADSTAIGTLTDQSGNGRDVTQATGSKQPVAQTVSGMKVARFDGTDDYLDIVYGATLTLPVTYVALVKSDDADTATRALMDGDANNTTRHLFYTAAGSWTVSFGSAQTVGTDDSAWHVLVITGSGTGDERVYIDGGAAAWTGASGSENASGLTLGATEDGNDCWDGDVNFFGVYDGDLRTDDLTLLNSLGQELADRAGITWTDIT